MAQSPKLNPLEAQGLSPYLVFLFLMLSTATLFEGFDAGMLSFAAPESRRTLEITKPEWGYLNSIVRLGVMISFFFLVYADRWGRRTMMLVTVIGFTVSNGLTAFVTDKYQFVACQVFSRLFLTAEYSLAVIMAGEEFPARWRGPAIAILTSLATVGVMIMAKWVQPNVLLPEGAESNWLHDLGAWLVASIQGGMGLEVDGESWRALYVLGAFPLIAVLLLRLAMRETRRFQAVRPERGAAPSLRELLYQARVPWRRAYRRRTAIVTVLWNSVHIVTGPSVVYYVIFAREEIGFSAQLVGNIVFWGYAGGTAGHFAAAWLMERIGRKWTCSSFYILAAISIAMLYQDTSVVGQYFWMIATVFCFGAANTATHVYASELFPTEIRATGYAWTTNLTGRITEVLTPSAIGLLIPLFGISWSIAAVAIGPIVGALIVILFAPETRGLTLEQIQEQLEPSPRARRRRRRRIA